MTAADSEIIQLDEGWERVKKEGVDPFLSFIENGEREFFKTKDFVMLYDLIFKMCIQRDPYNWSEEMYNRYTESCKRYHTEMVIPELRESHEEYGATFLRDWAKKWSNQKLAVRGLAKLFMYLDRFYTPNTDGVYKLKDQGHRLYKENVFDEFKEAARTYILKSVQRERDNEQQDRHLLNQAVQVFVEMGYNYGDSKLKVYQQDLEKYLIEHAGIYYQRMSRSWMDGDSCPNYLQKVEECLTSEKNRVDAYLNASTAEPLETECYKHLLQTHQAELLTKETGVNHLLEMNRTDDLSRLYRLYSKHPEDLVPIGQMVQDHIQKAGAALVDRESKVNQKAPGSNHSLVRNLIDLHDQYARVVRECFGNNQVFQKALKNAFESFINMDNRVSKLLAKFVNDVLKKHSKVTTQNLDSTLNNIVFLYGYITEKDVFERDYQYFLAHRLLMGLCESEHAEKSMIQKLRAECGYQWTNRLEGMFKDVSLSTDLMDKFRKVFDTEKNLGITFNVNVCTTGYWPSSKSIPCKIPKEVSKACDKFRRFYLDTHSGHKLEWRMDQGQAEVQVMFSPKVKRGLICSTYMMVILLCFNNQPKPLTFKQILDLTGIPRYEISNHILSLVHPSVKVLRKKPNTKSLEEDHMFMINPKFTSKILKVQIPFFQTVEDTKKKDEESAAILLQRQHQMDAAIVRIMKTRKELRHNRLIAEVIQQLSARFSPKPPAIKKRIEALIESEYLERDENDRRVYRYLA